MGVSLSGRLICLADGSSLLTEMADWAVTSIDFLHEMVRVMSV